MLEILLIALICSITLICLLNHLQENLQSKQLSVWLFTLIVLILIILKKQLPPSFWYIDIAFVLILLLVAIVDYQTFYIYDFVHYCIIALGLFKHSLLNTPSSELFLGFIVISAPLLIMQKLSSDSLGSGDVKLMISCGFYLGFMPIILAFTIGVTLCLIHSLYLLLQNKKHYHDLIAFGPYLCLGNFISLLYSANILMLIQ